MGHRDRVIPHTRGCRARHLVRVPKSERPRRVGRGSRRPGSGGGRHGSQLSRLRVVLSNRRWLDRLDLWERPISLVGQRVVSSAGVTLLAPPLSPACGPFEWGRAGSSARLDLPTLERQAVGPLCGALGLSLQRGQSHRVAERRVRAIEGDRHRVERHVCAPSTPALGDTSRCRMTVICPERHDGQPEAGHRG